jgi:ABC-type uncharacterized transport system auxiliary subunit
MYRWPLLLGILLLVQGCSGVLTSDQPARQYYLLQPLASSPPATAARAGDLAMQVTAIPGLDTDQLLALGADARLQQYSNARWPDHLPEVLASTLQRSLEATGYFRSVRVSDRAGDGDWRLQLEAREFYGIRDPAGNTESVRVALAGTLRCGGGQHGLDLRDSHPVTEQRLAGVVAAHQAALDAVSGQLVAQIGRLCPPGESQ